MWSAMSYVKAPLGRGFLVPLPACSVKRTRSRLSLSRHLVSEWRCWICSALLPFAVLHLDIAT